MAGVAGAGVFWGIPVRFRSEAARDGKTRGLVWKLARVDYSGAVLLVCPPFSPAKVSAN